MLARAFSALICLLLLHAAAPVVSEEHEGGEAEAANTRDFKYLAMTPAFVVNVGDTGNVGFLKADISLRVKSAAVAAVEHHMPALRHELILLLSRQTNDALEKPEGREGIRVEALEVTRKVLLDAEKIKAEEGVQDLLFTSFIVQR